MGGGPRPDNWLAKELVHRARRRLRRSRTRGWWLGAHQRARERLVLHVLTTLLCMARVPRAEVFLVFLKETAEAATESPAALERRVREKVNENSLTVWRGMSPEWRGALARGLRGIAGLLMHGGVAALGRPDWKSSGKWVDYGSGRACDLACEVRAAVRLLGTRSILGTSATTRWRYFESFNLRLRVRCNF